MPDIRSNRLTAEQLTALGKVHAAAALVEIGLRPYPRLDIQRLAQDAEHLAIEARNFADTFPKE